MTNGPNLVIPEIPVGEKIPVCLGNNRDFEGRLGLSGILWDFLGLQGKAAVFFFPLAPVLLESGFFTVGKEEIGKNRS